VQKNIKEVKEEQTIIYSKQITGAEFQREK